MKRLALVLIATMLISDGIRPVMADPSNDLPVNAVVENSNTQAHHLRFFHAYRKLALKDAAKSQEQRAAIQPTPAVDFGYDNTDSFIIN